MSDRLKIVVCREDLPVNPRWRSQGYPYENCWDIDEFFSEAARRGGRLLEEARRIYWECLPPYTVIPALIDGHFVALPIEQIVDLFKQGHDVRVLAPYSASPRGFKKPPKFTKVVGVREYEYRGKLIRIIAHYGREIITTPNHVIPVYRNGRYQFIPASEIREGDRLFTDYGYEIPTGNEIELVEPEIAELLGYALAEGCDVKHYATYYKGRWYLYDTAIVVNQDVRIQDQIRRLAREVGSYAYSRPKRPSVIRLGINIMKKFRELGINNLGKAHEKKIPMKVFWLPRQHLYAFVRALYSGDGCVKTERSGKYMVVGYATKSIIMAQQLYWLLRYLGFKYIRVVVDGNMYRLQLSTKEDLERFVKYIGFMQEEKNEIIKQAIKEGKIAIWPKLKRTVPVKKVEFIDYHGKVYDLAVERPHLYFAGFGVVVHNSYWRLTGRYKRGRRFFDVYKVVDGRVEPVRDDRWVLSQIVLAGNIYIVPEEAKISTRRIYRELFGPITR